MSGQNRENSGTLGRNKDKTPENPNWPDFKGKAEITCVHCSKLNPLWLSAWVKVGDGASKFFSIAFKPREAPAAATAPADTFVDDDIPF